MHRPILFLSALYSLAWAPILLMRGVYWDGWVFFDQYFYPDYAYIWATQFGPQRLYVHYELFKFISSTYDPVFTARAIVFFSWLVAGLLLYRILTRVLQWNTSSAFLVSAYYLVFPAFLVRFEIIHPYYSLANLFFVLAAYLYLTTPRTWWQKIVFEMSALFFFIASFFVNSFLVFYFAFLAIHAYVHSKRTRILSDIRAYVFRFWYLIALPFAFFVFASIYLKPYGETADYNELIFFRDGASLSSLMSTMLSGYWSGIWTGVIWPLASALMLMERKFFIVALLGALVLVTLLFRRFVPSTEECRLTLYTFSLSRNTAFLGAGLVLIFLALFPYIAVGKPPHIYAHGFALRHTLLIPLGMALLLYGAVSALFRERFQKMTHVTLLSISIAFLWYNFFLLDIDWYKQQVLLRQLPGVISDVRPSTYVIFHDKAAGLNWRGRSFSHHEYSGYLTLAAQGRIYHGMSATEFEETKEMRGLTATSTVHVLITSRRSDDPRVVDWVYLKMIDIAGGDLSKAAEERLQIVLTRDDVSQR
jgi:hypothetical protein